MNCPRCGAKVSSRSGFCTNCGCKVSQSAVNAVVPHQYKNGFFDNGSKNSNTKNKGIKIGIIVLIVLILLVGGLCAIFIIDKNNQAKEASFNIDISIPEFSDTNSTRIPVKLTQDNLELYKFVDSQGNGLSVGPGEYELSFPSSPLCENGNFYTAPNGKMKVYVEYGKADVFASSKCEFKKQDTSKLSDNEIDKAKDICKLDPEKGDKAEQYAQSTKDIRDNLVKEAKSKEKSAKKAKNAQLSKTQIVTGDYVNIEDKSYVMSVNVEKLTYEIKQNGKVVDKGHFLNKTKGLAYYKDEAITPKGEYGKQCFIVVSDDTTISMANRYLTLVDGTLVLDRKHDAAGAKPWEGEYTYNT